MTQHSSPTIDRHGQRVAELLEAATQALTAAGDSARLDSELLLSHVLGVGRATLRAWPERCASDAELALFRELLARRKQGEPLAYLTGEREFWSLALQVGPATLIPRPETECLVEQALACIPDAATWRIADLGTGSGAIALAIASERRGCRILATDISEAALAVARNNQQRLALMNVDFLQADWLAGVDGQPFNVILANPPYIDEDDPHLLRNGLPYEPRGALTPGADGLAAIKTIVQQATRCLIEPGWLMLEHGLTQGASVRALFAVNGYEQVNTLCDLECRERITVGRRLEVVTR